VQDASSPLRSCPLSQVFLHTQGWGKRTHEEYPDRAEIIEPYGNKRSANKSRDECSYEFELSLNLWLGDGWDKMKCTR
jgi:hypothetical protein